MENKINVAELLKNCPKGMELDCVIWYNVAFEEIDEDGDVVILRKSVGTIEYLSKYGECNSIDGDVKCIIFPKGKTTWEGFVPPCEFKDGDIIYTKTKGDIEFISIFKKYNDDNIQTYMDYSLTTNNYYHRKLNNTLAKNNNISYSRLCTEKEKTILFQVIKNNGWKWNDEKKCLEKLVKPKFKVGNIVQDEYGYRVKITEVNTDDECYSYISLYKGIGGIGFNEQDNWELVPDKFDITTLVPFESRVLIRDSQLGEWLPAVYGYTDNLGNHCVVGGNFWKYLIPYENNEHLRGTTNDCNEFYKTWEE